MRPIASIRPQVFETAATQIARINFPLLGIVMTALSTYLAIAIIPYDPEPKGALFNAALVMAIGLAAAPLAAAIRDPKSILSGENLLALGPIYWLLLDLLQGVYLMPGIEPEQVSKAFICIGLFVIGVWLAAYGRQWGVPVSIVRSISQDFSANTYFVLCIVAFLLGMLNFLISTGFDLPEMFHYVGQSRWAAPWGRGQLGGWDAFLDHLQYFGYLLPALTVIIANRVGWVDSRTILSAGMGIVMTVFLAQSGSRRIIGVIFGLAFVLWLLSQRRLRSGHMIIMATGVATVLLILQVMLEYRNVGIGSLIGDEQSESLFQRNYIHVDDNFYRLCQVIQFIPESYPFVYHKYLVWVLIRPIPRVFWADKPIDPGFDLPTALGVEGVSYSCSVLGELYMSAGLIGILLGGWFYGRIAGLASQLLTRNATSGILLVYSTIMLALFSGMRSMLELILISYVILAWIVLTRTFNYFKRRGAVRNPEFSQ